ncbi:MAG TPA: hypothetical protein VK177_01745, partial [Flavobacteriales bacterium]|nr:hypothetical protein [Flavobacteriales bacterium]
MDQTYQSNEDRLVAMRQFWAQTDDDWNTGALEKQANDSSQQIVNDILSTSSKIWPFSKDPIKKTIRLNKREVKLFIKKAKETVLRLKEAGAGEEHLDSIIQLITAYENEYENGNFDWSANDALQRFKDKVADENMRDEILLDVYYLNANFPSERMALDDLSNDADRPVYIPSIEINRLEHEEPVNDIRTHIKIEPTSEEIKKNTNDERKQLLKESGTLGGLTKKLVEKTGDDAYSLKNLQTNFFEKGTDFSGNLDLYGNVYGLWPNLILLYYLTQEAWTPAEGYPVVKSYVAPGGQLVILSTFKGSIQMQKDEKKQGDKNPGSAANNNAVITAYNHIAVKGLKDQAANGFYLYSNEEDYENVISLSDPDLGFKLRDDVKDGIALSRGYKLKESQYQQEYNILRENGYTKSISEYRANPISLRDFLEGGKIFENVNIPAIVNNGEGVNIRKNPFSPDDIERLGKNYEGPNPNFIKLIPFNTHLTVKRKTTQVGEDWAYIETENGDKGYASLVYIETEMPEPKARYHKVKEGETISLVAIKSHGSIDLTDYITALEIINPSI